MKKVMLWWIVVSLYASICYSSENNTTSYTLDNGLKLIIREDHRTPAAIAQIWYHVGSAQESLGSTGIAHALEHMMFQGTPTHPRGQFAETIHRLGGRFNAFTSYDMTVYHALVTANALPQSLELEADRLQHLNLWDENFEKELQVVIEERRLRVEDDPQQLFSERFFAEVLTANPYQNPVIGWQHDLDNLTTTDLRTFYNTWYAPNNATLIIVGDVNTKDMLTLVKKLFGKIPAKPVPTKKPVTLLRAFGEKRLQMNIPAKVPYVSLAYEVPTYPNHKTPRDIAALTLISVILDGDASSRLTQKLLREKALAASVRTEYDPLMRFPSLFILSATPSGSHTVAELEQALLEEINQLQHIPVTDKELQRAKTLWLANTTYTSDSVDQQALKIGAWENLGLPWETADTFDALLQTITPNDIQAVAQQYLGPNNRSVGFLNPASQGT